MRVLWVTYDIFNSINGLVSGRPSYGRPWVESLFNNLHDCNDISIAIATPVTKGKTQKLEFKGTLYYIFPKSKNKSLTKIGNKMRNNYIEILNDFKPDIIHIHGSEINLGLLKKYTSNDIPIVISIQGIIPPCSDYLRLSVANINYKKYRSLKNILGRGGVNGALRKWSTYIPIEKEIFKINRYFIGRTSWDKSYVSAYNPKAQYFNGEEILRDEFYNSHWEINKCERHSIFISSSAYALKGFHLLLKAASILKAKYPNIKIITPLSFIKSKRSKFIDLLISEDYNRFIKQEINRLNLTENVELKGYLSAKQMANEYKKAHIFVLPSFLENSPNSLGEAMIVGTPSVTALTGGVPYLTRNEIDVLSFPINDYIMMAYQIDRIFSNDNLAVKLSENAKQAGYKRHHIKSTVEEYTNIYKTIIKTHREESENE